MAQIETPQGSKLHWPDEQAPADQPNVADAPNEEVTSPDMVETNAATETVEAAVNAPAGLPGGRRPTKIMTDLTRAMQAAASSSREETMARLDADAKAAVEEIQASATGEGADIRRRADDDVAAVRDWSKTEIARIREEAEARISVRKSALDSEMEEHAAIVEARIQRVNAAVESFQGDMESFFERLLSEEDPTRIATMAETMPEPPDLASIAASIAGPTIEPFDPAPATWPADDRIGDAAAAPAANETAESEVATAGPDAAVGDPAAAESAEAPADPEGPPAAEGVPADADFAAAEAEAAAHPAELTEDDVAFSPQPASDDPAAEGSASAGEPTDAPASGDRVVTRVSVVGLVSVASIASFKRSLGRADGVAGIRVASGPDGEFVFTVEHDSAMSLSEAIAALPGFEARVTGQGDGTLDIAAHDPDTDA
jgi:hypothetical protein